jgi:hypothetical protein
LGEQANFLLEECWNFFWASCINSGVWYHLKVQTPLYPIQKELTQEVE